MRTHRRTTTVMLTLIMLGALVPLFAIAQGGPPPELRRVVDATIAVIKSADPDAVAPFAREQLTPAYLASMSPQELQSLIKNLRENVSDADGGLAIEAQPDGVLLVFGGQNTSTVRLRLGPETQWKIAELALVDSTALQAAGDTRDSAVQARAHAIEAIGRRTPEQSLAMLEQEHFVDGLFTGAERENLLRSLGELKRAIASAGMINLSNRGEQVALSFRGGHNVDVVFGVEPATPFRINQFLIDTAPAAPTLPALEPLAWDELESRFAAEQEKGFSGFVLAVREGKEALSQGFGSADRRSGSKPTIDTVFDIGSMPIDFTRAAILYLAQESRLTMDDQIDRFFDGVPSDKAGITIGQLMTGRSGLSNFHGIDTDADKDLTLIDSDAALQRIFEQPLLFAPGSDHSHSHSAFGVLALVIEKVSGKHYGEFLESILFKPAKMTRTGFYGEDLGLAPTEFAEGYGKPASSPNIPPLWGRVSWLVIGSGGMVSSVGDMQRALNYIASGQLLKGNWLSDYLRLNIAIGGSERGFFFLRVSSADGSSVFMASNSGTGPADNQQLARSLIAMVLPDRDG